MDPGLEGLPLRVSVCLICKMWLTFNRADNEFLKTDHLFLTLSCYVAGFQYAVSIKIISRSHEPAVSQGISTPILADSSYTEVLVGLSSGDVSSPVCD